MKFNSRIISLILFAVAFLVACFFFSAQETKAPTDDSKVNGPDFNLLVNKLVEEKDEVLENVNVPFTPQAPSGQWDNPIYQDGCEEAAALMAVYWAEGKGLDKNTAESEIISIADYEEKNYGSYYDTSIEDTAEIIIQGYFGYTNFEVRKNISLNDIIKEIELGRVVIAPFDGRLLNNPYYTAPGPERHNLVIKGYDSAKKEFITNDPGTKRGEGYRYSEEILYNALRDYPTGDHEPIVQIEKNIIAVWK